MTLIVCQSRPQEPLGKAKARRCGLESVRSRSQNPRYHRHAGGRAESLSHGLDGRKFRRGAIAKSCRPGRCEIHQSDRDLLAYDWPDPADSQRAYGAFLQGPGRGLDRCAVESKHLQISEPELGSRGRFPLRGRWADVVNSDRGKCADFWAGRGQCGLRLSMFKVRCSAPRSGL